eukprot:7080041-Lingulodinium_polyedra.AAC.1
MSVCTNVHASSSSAPMSMPLDMDVNAFGCKHERLQRRNGPCATERTPAPQITPNRNAINL